MQHTLSKEGDAPPFTGDVLLGMAQTITGEKPAYLDRLLTYLSDSAKAGFSPARAIYAQIMAAHEQKLEISQDVLDDWMLQAVAEGYLFAKSGRLKEEVEGAKGQFRDKGGFCSDPFLRKPDVKSAMSKDKCLGWIEQKGFVIDRNGNTLLHAAAAYGAVDAILEILDAEKIPVDITNENLETPLYKAFQAGQSEAVEILLDYGASVSCRTLQKIHPLHWLFIMPENSIQVIVKRMVEGSADINAMIEPVVKDNSGGFPEKIQIFH